MKIKSHSHVIQSHLLSLSMTMIHRCPHKWKSNSHVIQSHLPSLSVKIACMQQPSSSHICRLFVRDLLQSISVLKLAAVLVFTHIQCYYTALSHHPLWVSEIVLKYDDGFVRCNGAQGLSTLVSHHRVFLCIHEVFPELRHRGVTLNLAQHVGDFMTEQCTLTLQTCNK